MTKTATAKNKEVLDQLFQLVVKQGAAMKPMATGIPGKDPDSGAVSAKHDTVDQNAVKPENLTPQHHEQKPSTDPAKPTGGKKAEEAGEFAPETKVAAESAPAPSLSVEKLGQEITALLQKFANGPTATGIPSHDPKWQAVSDKHDHVDQNAVGAEKLTPQGYSQKPATGPSIPVAHAKMGGEVEDASKVASYELGKLWAELVIKKAQDEQLAQVKEAGRRDFETLISHAAAQMKQASRATEKTASVASSGLAEKRAEQEGAAAFQSLYKQAQVEQAFVQLVEQNRQLQAKVAAADVAKGAQLAELNAKIAAQTLAIEKAAAEEKEQQKFAALASHLEERIVARLERAATTTR